jgi:hypothetical protein
VDGAHFHVNSRTHNVNDALAKSLRPRHLPVADAFAGDYRDYQHERFVLSATGRTPIRS